MKAEKGGIRCPTCGGPMSVCFTRQRPGYVYRRRECMKCGRRIRTAERIFGDVDAEK